MSLFKNIFHKVRFLQPDPLANGLAEEIAAEQAEPEAIMLTDSIDGDELANSWQHIVDEFHNDPDWVDLGQDD